VLEPTAREHDRAGDQLVVDPHAVDRARGVELEPGHPSVGADVDAEVEQCHEHPGHEHAAPDRAAQHHRIGEGRALDDG